MAPALQRAADGRASLNAATDTRYRGNNADLRGLPKIEIGGQASLFARYTVGSLAFEAAVKERIGPANDVSADFAVNYRVRLSDDWSVAFGPSLTVAEGKLNNAFFGVTEQDAVNTASFGNPLRPYRAGAGIRNISLNTTTRYAISENWGVAARLELDLLVGRVGNSPITRQEFQSSFGSFVYYRF